MSDVKDLLNEAVGSLRPRADQRAVEARVERRKQRRRVIAASTALMVFAAAGTLSWAAFAPGDNQGAGTGSASLITHTVQGVTVTHRASWTLIDLWPLSRSIATWPEPVGSSISVPDDTPERGGLPVLQLSNEDLGLRSLCGTDLIGQESFLYVALNGGPFRVNPDGSPVWMSELSEGGGPCGRGWYAYKTVNAPYGDVTTSTPYLVFAGFGPTVSQGDRDAVFAAFDSLDFAPFDFLHPPNEGSPSYVRSDATLPPVAEAVIVPDVIGLLREEAVGQLESLGLTVAVALTTSEDTQAGTIASQDPAPGTSVDAGTTVTIVISDGAGAQTGDLGGLPQGGVAVGSNDAVVLLDLDGTIATMLQGFEIAGNAGAPGVWLQHGRKYFKLDVTRGVLVRVAEAHAREVMYDEGPEPSLPPPTGAVGPDGEVAGHWRYAVESSSGATLAQWSGECEVPMAYWIEEDGNARIVTGESSISRAPESLGLGWTANGRAVVFLPKGACASGAEVPGIYLYSSPGAGRLVYQTRDGLLVDSWGIGL